MAGKSKKINIKIHKIMLRWRESTLVYKTRVGTYTYIVFYALQKTR